MSSENTSHYKKWWRSRKMPSSLQKGLMRCTRHSTPCRRRNHCCQPSFSQHDRQSLHLSKALPRSSPRQVPTKNNILLKSCPKPAANKECLQTCLAAQPHLQLKRVTYWLRIYHRRHCSQRILHSVFQTLYHPLRTKLACKCWLVAKYCLCNRTIIYLRELKISRSTWQVYTVTSKTRY